MEPHCAERRGSSVQPHPPCTAQAADLLRLQAHPPGFQGMAQSLIRGSLLMLALAQRWFLWQLQRRMQG